MFTLPRCQVIFQWKQTKEKLGIAKCVKISAKYIQQWRINHFNIYIWLETFRYYCTWGQLNNEEGGELHEIKQSWDKMEIGKEIIC